MTAETYPTTGPTMPAPYPLDGPGAIGRPKTTNDDREGSSEPQNRAGTYTCSGCDTRWSGVSRCHCHSCHRTFGGEWLFDRHRRDVNDVGTCLDPETLFSVRKTGERKGERERDMFLTAGLWQGVETPVVKRGPARR